MSEQDTEGAAEEHPREDDRNETVGTPIPDPEEELGDTEDVPSAD